ncbi:hypothetical protein P43SY_003430 [Pythium insidiosum]|uniref:Tc1-like transposase DDE domain-containing protein n=1 Tax=Pythium insidiosum TaxID=114742 RepID=A0AAD5L9G9_PYTIN|nr:hypothetical protein P43SY_003430 [Pythium insidiosum]
MHVEYLFELLEENPLLTLADELYIKHRINVVAQTIRNSLDAMCYTIKQTHKQPADIKAERVKIRRKEYILKIMKAQADGKHVIFFDETGYNLCCARNRGWSRRGTRAVHVRDISRGQSLNVICAISEDGVEYVKYLFGSTKADTVAEFVRRLLREVVTKISLFDVVIVCDNASVHNSVTQVIEEPEFVGVEAIPLSPYSPMLKPIENTFSVFKSAVQTYLAEHCQEILTVPSGTTKTKHRAAWLRRATEYSMSAKVTSDLCPKLCRHSQRFYIPALAMADMPIGA